MLPIRRYLLVYTHCCTGTFVYVARKNTKTKYSRFISRITPSQGRSSTTRRNNSINSSETLRCVHYSVLFCALLCEGCPAVSEEREGERERLAPPLSSCSECVVFSGSAQPGLTAACFVAIGLHHSTLLLLCCCCCCCCAVVAWGRAT